MTRRGLLLFGLTALLVAGCTVGPEPKPVFTLVLVDETGLQDDPSVVQCHREAIEQILTSLPPDRKSILCLDTVSANSRLRSRPKKFAFAPKGWDDTTTTYTRRLDSTRRQVRGHWEKLLKASDAPANSSQTTLLDSFDIVSKLRPDRLVVLSDGFEQSRGRYDFTAEKDLSDRRIDEILKQEESRLPNLSGIEAWWVAAASDQARLEPARLRWVEKFWSSYFDRTGARLPGERYASVLIHWTWTIEDLAPAAMPRPATRTYDHPALVSH